MIRMVAEEEGKRTQELFRALRIVLLKGWLMLMYEYERDYITTASVHAVQEKKPLWIDGHINNKYIWRSEKECIKKLK